MPDGASAAAGQTSASAATNATHTVQFYEDEAFLAGAVAEFLEPGLAAGHPLIVIATERRRRDLSARLKARGFDVARARQSGRITLLDARDTLARVMAGPMPDDQRFAAALTGVIESTLRGRGDTPPLRMYGEMVDVLWGDGNTAAAIRLEELWNDLASRYDFSLLCAYHMGHFYREGDAHHFREICQQHTHVVPTERYTRADDATRLLEISALQQRARSLETEIEHRKELERRLREALAERRLAEEALRQRERELERAAAERECLLAREQAARAEAEAANRAKSDFLAVMSHELRTPLNAIAGYVQLLEMGVQGPVNDRQRDALARTRRSQRHLLSLINDVLNLSRIESGRVEYTLERIPLEPLLADLTAMVAPLLWAKELTCEIRSPANAADHEVVAVRADPDKLRQIVLNLLNNAIKFTPAGGRITLEASRCPEAPAAVCLQVRDTGVGIPASKLEAIFEPFVQLGRQPGSPQDGVGLGLAISRDLARGMGGDLVATSTAGGGATFTLTVPRA